MEIAARVGSTPNTHQVTVSTNDISQALVIAPKATGPGSSVNGGELLMAALATCYCNDLYREAAKRGIVVEQVTVTATAAFGAPGEPARNITYQARVVAHADTVAIADLIRATDTLAEIQNTLRAMTPVTLAAFEAVPASSERAADPVPS